MVDERQRVVAEWNRTAAGYDPRGVHHLVAAQAARTPDAVAVVDGHTRVTYAELVARANRLARQLRADRVGPEVRVAIGIDPSVDLLVAMMAVLTAGGTYVPLDLRQPTSRLAALLADVAPAVLVTTAASHPRLPPAETRLLDVDAERAAISQRPATAPDVPWHLDQLAYVIYTSGSTGRPKGVLVTHRGLTNYLQWASAAYGFDRQRNAVVHTSASVDLTVTALWGPLLGGGTVEVMDSPGLDALAARIRRGNLGVLKLTPTHLRALAGVEGDGLGDVVVVGGESLTGADLAGWRRVAPAMPRINEYGPTETVVGSCVYRDPSEGRSGPVPIGRPIANTQAYVLDEAGEPVRVGEVGELYLGGEGVGRGYWNRAADTAMRFVPDPFGPSGSRLYRTGDRARWLPTGDLEFLGRIDAQVKIRGHRIETGEIEVALVSTGLVRAAVVVVREGAGGPQLVAYGLVRDAERADVATWRRGLRALLPEPMVPAVFVAIDELPLTPSGKVDRQALARGAPVRPSADAVPPRTELERRVQAIWQSVLDIECDNVHVRFDDVGGQSLSVVILAKRLADTFGVPLTVTMLLEHPTIESMAEFLAAAAAGAGDRSAGVSTLG